MARVKIGDYGNLDDAQRQGIDEIEYAGGQIGRKVQGGWQYGDLRPEAFQDALSENDIQQQGALKTLRASGQKVDEGDAGAFAMPKNASPAQQWNAQPAAPQGPAGGTGNALMQLLMQRAQQGPVSANDPNVRAQVDPGVAQMTRASRNYIDDVAERSGPRANIQGERRLASERLGQGAAALEGEVLGREIGGRRQEISEALQMWGHLMSDEQRMGLERELATMGMGLQREGMYLGDRQQTANRESSMEQFMRELALREWQAGEDNAYRWAGV